MNLLKSLVIVSSMTVFSRILGFVRDIIVAKIFGAGVSTDAFFIAFKLPNLLRRIFAEGAFLQIFIPILTEYKNKQSRKVTRMFIAYMLGILILILVIVTILGILIAPWIVTIIAPGFVDTLDKFILTSQLLRIIFPYILLISLTSFSGAILNIWNYFLVPACAPIFFNITIICFALLTSQHFNPPILSLAWAVTISGILQLIYHLQHLKKINMLILPRISFSFYDIGIRKAIKQIIAAVLGNSISQISSIINTILASFLVSGSISWIYYADRLIEFPSGILSVTLSTILLPFLSKNFFNGNHNEYCRLIDWGLRLCFLLALPSAIALGILAKPIIVTLFLYGKFTINDVLMTQKALIACLIGILGSTIAKVLALGFYSRQDTKTPIKTSIIAVITTQLMNPTFINLLEHAGLSFSIAFSACLNAVMLYRKLQKKNIFIPCPGWIYFLLRLMIAVLTMAVALLCTLYLMPDWTLTSISYRLLNLLIEIIIGTTIYFISLSILGFKIKEFISQINNLKF